MSPILVRPVREQLEHDRVIRLLQAKYKRKFEVAINPGSEQAASVGDPASPWYPDLVLYTSDKTRKLAGVVEVESAESVNHLEAMSQWKAFASLNVPFHLYLPTASVDTARRFCADMDIPVAEMWAYQSIGDQIRFTVVQRTTPAPEVKPARPAAASVVTEGRSRAGAASRTSAPSARTVSPAARAALPAPSRTNGDPTRRPATRRTAAAPARAAAATSKTAAGRRPASKVAARKTKAASSSSRAHKRR